MFRRFGGLAKAGHFGRPFKWQAHLEPAGRQGSAVGSRGPLGLLPHQWGVEVHQASSPHLSKISRNVCGPYAYGHGPRSPHTPFLSRTQQRSFSFLSRDLILGLCSCDVVVADVVGCISTDVAGCCCCFERADVAVFCLNRILLFKGTVVPSGSCLSVE